MVVNGFANMGRSSLKKEFEDGNPKETMSWN